MSNWIQTKNGHCFDPDCLEEISINIEDIAWSLSLTPRFRGHLHKFYSVAQHSIWVSENCEERYAMCGLLHDASEAYLSDIPGPIKLILPDYEELETRVMGHISKIFGIEFPIPKNVKMWDTKACIYEAQAFMPKRIFDWDIRDMKNTDFSFDFEKEFSYCTPLTSDEAYKSFLRRFQEITKTEVY